MKKGAKVKPQIDVEEKLRGIAKSSPTAEFVFRMLSKRDRASRRTNLPVFKSLILKEGKMKKFDNEAYAGLFRQLEQLGVGTLSVSETGKPREFHWDGVNPVSVGAAAIDPRASLKLSKFRKRELKKTPKEILSPLGRFTEPSTPTKQSASMPQVKRSEFSDTVYAVFMTQNSESVNIQVNKGLTEEDKQNLISMIESLPTKAGL